MEESHICTLRLETPIGVDVPHLTLLMELLHIKAEQQDKGDISWMMVAGWATRSCQLPFRAVDFATTAKETFRQHSSKTSSCIFSARSGNFCIFQVLSKKYPGARERISGYFVQRCGAVEW
jgi:hypothetical protein